MFKRLSARVKKFWAALALLSIEMIIVLTLFGGALVLFVYMIRRVFFLRNNQFDDKVFAYLDNHASSPNKVAASLSAVYPPISPNSASM